MSSPDRAVDTDATFRQLRKFFPDDESTIEFYAARRSQTFGARNVPAACELCGQPDQHLRMFSWRRRENRRSVSAWSLLTILGGGLMIKHESKEFKFDTYHTLCPQCWNNHQKANTIRIFIYIVSITALVLLWIAIALMLRMVDLQGLALVFVLLIVAFPGFWKIGRRFIFRHCNGLKHLARIGGGLFFMVSSRDV